MVVKIITEFKFLFISSASNVNEDYGAETKLVKKTRYEDESEKYDMPNTRSKSVTRGSCAGNSCTTSSDISPIAGPSGYRLGYSLRSMSGIRNPVASLGESNCEISKEEDVADPSGCGRDLLSSLPKPPTEGFSVADPSSYPSQLSPSTNSDCDVDGIDTLLKHKSEVIICGSQ